MLWQKDVSTPALSLFPFIFLFSLREYVFSFTLLKRINMWEVFIPLTFYPFQYLKALWKTPFVLFCTRKPLWSPKSNPVVWNVKWSVGAGCCQCPQQFSCLFWVSIIMPFNTWNGVNLLWTFPFYLTLSLCWGSQPPHALFLHSYPLQSCFCPLISHSHWPVHHWHKTPA